MNRIQSIGLGIGATALVLGGALGVTNLAHAEDAPTPTPAAEQDQQHQDQPPTGDASRHGGALAADLAEKLGVDEATVTEALTALDAERDATRLAALEARLAEAVTDGTLTQAEADGAKKAVEAGIIGGGGPGGHGGKGPRGGR